MIHLNETTRVRIRPTEPVQGLVRVDFCYCTDDTADISRTTAFMRIEDRTWTSPPPVELTTEQIDALFVEYNSTETVKSSFRRSMHVDAEKRDDGTFDVWVSGEGFELDALGAFLESLREFSGEEESTFLTLPVVRDLEDPELMAELDSRLAAVRDGTAKTVTLEEVLAQLKWDHLDSGRSEESDEVPVEGERSGVGGDNG